MNTLKAQNRRWIQEFLFKTPLFAPKVISFVEASALFGTSLVVYGHCPYCGKASTFYRNRGGKGILHMQPLVDANEPIYFDLICTRDVKHRIIFCFRFDGNQIQKTAQHPPLPKVSDSKTQTAQALIFEKMREVAHYVTSFLRSDEKYIQKLGRYLAPAAETGAKTPDWGSAALGKTRDVAQNIASRFRIEVKQIQKTGQSFLAPKIIDQKPKPIIDQKPQPIIDHKPQLAVDYKPKPKTSAAFENARLLGERFRAAEPYFIGVGLPIAAALAIIGIFALHENAYRQTGSELPIKQAAQSADDRRNEDADARLKIAVLAQRLDEGFATFRKELETVDRSVSADQGLVAAINARLDQQKQELDKLELMALDQTGSTKKNVDKPEAGNDVLLEQEDASADALVDQPEGDADTSKLMTLEKPAPATPKADNPPSIPHLGIGVAASGLASAGGVVIVEVDPGSPAGRAGVRKRDVLLRVDGTAVNSPEKVRKALLSLKGSNTVVLTLQREGKTQNNKLTLR
jgi:hypothetical protein